ncbi:motility associated factor glycosyltransferase family protein [Lysinibacillus sp. NPDC097287]|uniref:motility associated factor glycosyltransferase family protein n=1 Tax=Lysinibacillus sp. NPDC097287 TaxID=3364144 RepID=UPI00381DBAE4
MSKYHIEYLPTKNNLETVMVNGYLLHSKYNPVQESTRIIEKEFEPNVVHVLFGYGLGYLAETLIAKINDPSKLIIIDPIYSFLRESEKGYSVISQFEKLEFEAIIEKALKNFNKKVKVICSPNYDKILPEELKGILKVIKDVQMSNVVNENTLRRYADSWQENYLHNLLDVYQNNSLSKLQKYYSCPVVVASGGPSLTKQLPLLKKMQDHVIIIAAGSTINSLLNKEIEPDYIVTVDGAIENYKHFKGIKNIKSKLIYAMTSHYKIQGDFVNDKYAFVDSLNIEYKEHINKILSIELPLIIGGASVANFAYSIASYITTGPIAMIGQDLAYTDNRSHAESNKHFKKIDTNFREKRELFEIPGYTGDMVSTDYVFLSMKNSFEALHKHSNHDAAIYNCTEGGAKIEEIDQLPFSDFFEMYVDDQTQLNKEVVNDRTNADIQKFIRIMDEYIASYNDLIKELKLALKVLSQNKSNLSFETKTLKKLDKIDGILKMKFEQISLNYITNPITLDVLRNYEPTFNESSRDTYRRVYNQNKEMYSRLLEAIEKTKGFTMDVIEEAKKI